MNDPFIPMNAYIFIGVASLVLAFVTVMDNQPVESNESEVNENEKSFTEYLPTFNGSNETVNEVAKEPTGETSNDQPQNDMFNSNLNSDQGLAQNEAPLLPQPQAPVQQKQYGNPFTGGKNKTGKNNATKNVTKNGKSKRNKKTKRYNSK